VALDALPLPLPAERIPTPRAGPQAGTEGLAQDLNWPALVRAREQSRRKASDAGLATRPVDVPAAELIQERIARPPRNKTVASDDPLAWPALPQRLDSSGLIPQEWISLSRPASLAPPRRKLPEFSAFSPPVNLPQTLTAQERIPLPPLRPRPADGSPGFARARRSLGVTPPQPLAVEVSLSPSQFSVALPDGAPSPPVLDKAAPVRKKLPTLEALRRERPRDSSVGGGSSGPAPQEDEAMERLRKNLEGLQAIAAAQREGNAPSLAPSRASQAAGAEAPSQKAPAPPESSAEEAPGLLPQARLPVPRRARQPRAAAQSAGEAADWSPPSPPASPPASPRLPQSKEESRAPVEVLSRPERRSLAWPTSQTLHMSPARVRVGDSSAPSTPSGSQRSPIGPSLSRAVAAAFTATDRPMPLSPAVRVLSRPAAAQQRAIAAAMPDTSWAAAGQSPGTTTVAMPTPPVLPRVLVLALKHHTLTGLIFALQCAAPRSGVTSPMRCHVFWSTVAVQMLCSATAVSSGARFSLTFDQYYLALPDALPVLATALLATAAGMLNASVFRLALWVESTGGVSWAAAWVFNGLIFCLALVCASIIGALADWEGEAPSRVLMATWMVGAILQWLVTEPLLMFAACAWARLRPTHLLARVQIVPRGPLESTRFARINNPATSAASSHQTLPGFRQPSFTTASVTF